MTKNVSGMVTLLVVSLLLILSLIATLGLHQALFYQIRRAHNELEARQQFWIAQGGLECALSLMYDRRRLLSASDTALCQSHAAVQFEFADDQQGRFTVGVSYGYRHVQQSVNYTLAPDGQLDLIAWQSGSWSGR